MTIRLTSASPTEVQGPCQSHRAPYSDPYVRLIAVFVVGAAVRGAAWAHPPPGGSRRHRVRAMSPGFEKIRLPVMWRTSAHLLPGSMRLPGMRRLLEPPGSSWTVPYPGVIRLVRSRTPWPLGSTATGRPARSAKGRPAGIARTCMDIDPSRPTSAGHDRRGTRFDTGDGIAVGAVPYRKVSR